MSDIVIVYVGSAEHSFKSIFLEFSLLGVIIVKVVSRYKHKKKKKPHYFTVCHTSGPRLSTVDNSDPDREIMYQYYINIIIIRILFATFKKRG